MKKKKNRARAARQALLPGIPAGIPVEVATSTMQVPFGEFSVLSELANGELNAFSAMTALTLGYFSNWQSGETWRVSQQKLSAALDMSVRSVRGALDTLKSKDWVSILTPWRGNDATRYKLKLHKCEDAMVPTDRDGNPSMFAIPHKTGGIFERMLAGDISWRGVLLWIRLKLHSDWQTGITTPMSLDTIATSVRMGKQTVVKELKALTDAGLLRKISKPFKRSQFQLYPKPPEKRAAKRRRVPVSKQRAMRTEGEWTYSHNGLFKMSTKTGEIFQRTSRRRGKWKRVREERYHEIPSPIKMAFDKAIEVAVAIAGLRGRLGMLAGVT